MSKSKNNGTPEPEGIPTPETLALTEAREEPAPLPAIRPRNQVEQMGLSDAFDAFEKNELEVESLNAEYLNFEDQEGIEMIFVFIEKTTIPDTVNNTDERVPAVVLMNKNGDKFINADKQLVSKLTTEHTPPFLVKITNVGMKKSKNGFKYRDFNVIMAVMKQ